jgi:hypothetical protein
VGAVTLEHLNKVYSESAGDSALKDFKVRPRSSGRRVRSLRVDLADLQVYGYANRDDLIAGRGVLLLQDTYDIDRENPIQTFRNIKSWVRRPLALSWACPSARDASQAAKSTQMAYARLEILNNHGNSQFTCLYRFRVHSSEEASAAL